MSFTSGLIHVAGDVASPLIHGIAGADSLLGDKQGASRMNSVATAIGSPNQVLTNPSGILNVNSTAFSAASPVAANNGVQGTNNNGSQPGTTNTNSSIYSGGGANGTGTGNAADIAAYQDQINQYNQLLQSADASAQSGQQNIDRNYQSGYNQLQDQQNQALQGYATQKQNTDQNYQQTQQGINSNSRNSYNSLQRLLAGSGSAAEQLAPYLVAQQANQQKTGAATTYAQNTHALDDATQGAQTSFKHALDNLLGQKNDKMSSLLSSIAQQKIQYQQALGAANNQLNVAKGGNYQTPTANNNAIAALIAQQQGLSSQYADPVFQVDHVSTAAPDLSKYQAQAAQLGNGSNQPVDPTQDATSSALAALLKQHQDQNTNSSYAY